MHILKQEYNDRLDRFYKMTNWCNNSTVKEQQAQAENIIQVIEDCSNVLNEILKHESVSKGEIINGFKFEV